MPVPKLDLGTTYIFGIMGLRDQEGKNTSHRFTKENQMIYDLKKKKVFCILDKIKNEILNTKANIYKRIVLEWWLLL